MTRRQGPIRLLLVLGVAGSSGLGCDKQADDRIVKTPPAKARVLVFTRPPDDPDYRTTVRLSATSGNT